MNTDFAPAEVFPPGEYVLEEIEARGWSKGEFAEIINRSPKFVSELLAGKISITIDTARRLGSAFGNRPEFWIHLDTTYRLHNAPTAADDTVAQKAKLYSAAPVSEMIKRGWISDHRSDVEQLASSVLKFLRVSSLDDAPSLKLFARKGTDGSRITPEQRAWLGRAVELAESTSAAKFRAQQFSKEILGIRELSANVDDIPQVPAFLANLGIRMVVVEHLPRTKIDGACFWLDDKSPAVAISLRSGRIDSFWYTLGHELGHIAHGHSLLPLDDNLVHVTNDEQDKSTDEMQADAFANSMLVSKERLDSFISRTKPLFPQKVIREFAETVGVHPGVILGQLQFRKVVSYAHCRTFLVDVRKQVLESTLHDGWGNVPVLERATSQ